MNKVKKCNCINDKILIRPEPEETTSSGIVLIRNTKQKQDTVTTGIVVHAPSEFLNKDGKVVHVALKNGDRLLFGQNVTGLPIEVDGEKLLIISYYEIIGVIK